jgi:putative heme iron utilization protein
LTGVLTAAYKKLCFLILNGLTGINLSKGIYNNGFAVVAIVSTKFSLTDYRVTIISSEIENKKLLKIQALSEFCKAQAIDPDVLVGIMNRESVHEVEYS